MKMKKEFLKIAVVFNLSPEVAQVAIKLSAEINQQAETFFVLDSFNFHPHVSIYHVEIPVSKLNDVLEEIEKISKNYSIVKFIAGNIFVTRGYIDVGAKSSQGMQYIHEDVVKNISLFREIDPLEESTKLSSLELTDEKKENIKKYGDSNLMNLYRPHLTFTRLQDEKVAEKIASEIHWPITDFVLDTIGVYERGENGTCLKIIREFILG